MFIGKDDDTTARIRSKKDTFKKAGGGGMEEGDGVVQMQVSDDGNFIVSVQIDD